MESLGSGGLASQAGAEGDPLLAERSFLAVAGAKEGVWDWDLAAGTVWYSDRWCRMLGYAPAEVPPLMTFWEAAVHPDDLPQVRQALSDHLLGRTEYGESEHRVRTRAGDWIWVHSRGQAVQRDARGRVIRLIGTNADITERKERELGREFLLKLNDRMRHLDDPAEIVAAASAALGAHYGADRVGFAEIDADQTYMTVHSDWTSGRVGTLAGCWRLDAFGQVMLDRGHRGQVLMACDTETDPRLQEPVTAGTWRQIETRAWMCAPLIRSGRPTALLYVHTATPRRWSVAQAATLAHVAERLWDIVHHERALAALHASEARLAQAAEAAGFGVWEWTVTPTRFETSENFDALFGLPRHAIRSGADLHAAIHPDDRERVQAVQASLWSADRPDSFDTEFRINLPDGTIRWLRGKGAVMARAADGTPARLNGVMFDTSDKKEAEAELRIAQEISLRASRLSAMGALASTLAHELNQPLASTTNYLAACRLMLQREGDADRDALFDCLDRGNASVIRASEIIRRMRRFTISGKVTRSEGLLRDILARAWDPLRQKATAMGVILTLDLAPGTERVVCDVLQIEQVIGNLLRNAVDAMAHVPLRRLTITARPGDGQLILSIRDSGPGLSAEARKHLFEPFRTSKANGTGLGLAICRTVVEAHGGAISIGRESGPGAEFVITLPQDGQAETDLAA